jgi:hypothetical protein
MQAEKQLLQQQLQEVRLHSSFAYPCMHTNAQQRL